MTVTSATQAAPETSKPPPRPKKKGRNYAQIHSKPLPLEVHPLPAFHPSNPISLLRIAYCWISHLLYPPTSHPPERYTGYFSPETRSIHITDPGHARALWEMGFFGKGTLSRSEPSWLDREKARLRSEVGGRKAAEDATAARRKERRLFKLERARAERERIERQRLVEQGVLDPAVADATDEADAVDEMNVDHVKDESDVIIQDGLVENEAQMPLIVDEVKEDALKPEQQPIDHDLTTNKINLDNITNITNQEHLQLTLEEAFFLHYGLGVLDIILPPPADSPPMSPKSTHAKPTSVELLHLFSQYSTSPLPALSGSGPSPDDQFLLNYVTYHHYRSLGWVVRPGVKFGVDYMLYNRGPVFSHAEFAVVILPAYSHRYWNSPGGRGQRRVGEKDWWWFHCVNRVQSQVKKSLVLCYVEVPSPFEVDWTSVGPLLGAYRVREFVVRRWLVNRSRD